MREGGLFDSIAGRRSSESPAEAAARSVELYLMAMKSWKLGRRVACTWTDFFLSAGAQC